MMSAHISSPSSSIDLFHTYPPSNYPRSKSLNLKKARMPELQFSNAKSDMTYTFQFKKAFEGNSLSRQNLPEPVSFVLDAFPNWNVQTLQRLISQLDKKLNDTGHPFEKKLKSSNSNLLFSSPLMNETKPSKSSISSPSSSLSSHFPSVSSPSSIPHTTSSIPLSLSAYDLPLPLSEKNLSHSISQVASSFPLHLSSSLHVAPSRSIAPLPHFNPKTTITSKNFVSDWVLSLSTTKPSNSFKSRKISSNSTKPLIVSSSSSVSSLSTTSSYFTSYSSKYNPSELMKPVKLGKLGISKDADFEKKLQKVRKTRAYGDYIRQSHSTSLPKKGKTKPDNLVNTHAFDQRKRIQEYALRIPKPKTVTLPPIDTQSKIPVRITSSQSLLSRNEKPASSELESATQSYYQDLHYFESLKREFRIVHA